ncbi:unnamed protein product [Paramecium octaurelia]|uniref:Uncharacterized protein n=1 Tax=Paramecium octaurelia TaxID=43137 RepID=A0A8S1S530_PAROT|nr:unnamed protein product [Paramecium octaurelia]
MNAPKCKEKNHFDREITLFCLHPRCQQKWGCQKCLSSHHKSHTECCISVSELEDTVVSAKKKIREIVEMKFSDAIIQLDEASKLLVKKIRDVINSVQRASDVIQDQIFKELELFDYLIDGFQSQSFTTSLSNEHLDRVIQLMMPEKLQQMADHKQSQINQLLQYSKSVLEQASKFTIYPLDEIALGIKLKEFQEGEYTLAVKEYNQNNIGICYLLTNGRLNKIGQYDNGLRSGMWSEVLYYNHNRDFSITFRGQYHQGLRVNHWFYYNQDQSVIGGGQFEGGQKIGLWVEPEVFIGKWGRIIVIHKGEYVNGVRHGEWATIFGNRGQVGGGAYLQGLKHGLWTDVEGYAGFWCSMGILNQGEYVNGVKVGLWLISELNSGQIGGGNYSQIGLKEGLWTEVEVHVGVGSSIILLHVGDYKAGLRQGNWKVLDICRNQIGGGLCKGYKKGVWTEVEICIGWRSSQILLHKGEYKKGQKIGIWNIYKEGSDTIIGGGNYIQDQKDGKWTDIEIYCGYYSTKTLIYTGDYNLDKRIGKWVISEQQEGVIGGGLYSRSGEKESDWVEVEMQVGWRCFVIIISEGEYCSGKRSGLWITKLYKGNQLGGGCYNKYGFKEGGWKEVEVHVGVGKYLTLYHIGEYRSGIRTGNWVVQNEQREVVSSGFYTKSGSKDGEWVEISAHDGIEDTITLLHIGEYNHGVRVGRWNIEKANKELIGGGNYSLSGIKEGQWQEVICYIGYNSEVVLQYNGLYSNGVRQGKWAITKVGGEFIGGGQYSDFGTKMGKWIDVDVRVGGGCSIILKYFGNYDDGIRTGEWQITQHGSSTINGGGRYTSKGIKVDGWIEIVPHIGYCNLIILKYIGEYKNNTRVGSWSIMHQEEIGGGSYLVNGMKNGKWIEVFQQYFDSLTIMTGEYVNGNKLQDWEYVDKLLKDL